MSLKFTKLVDNLLVNRIRAIMHSPTAEAPIQSVLLGRQGGIPSGRLENWHEIGATDEPAFQNSWVNFSGSFASAAFRKLPTGLVVIKGIIKDGTNGTIAFTLPVGYRPALTHIMGGRDNAGAFRVDIQPDGDVKIGGGAYNTFLSFGTIIFMAEQ